MTTQIYHKVAESDLYNDSLLTWLDELDVLGIGCQRAVLFRERLLLLASNAFCLMYIRLFQ